MKLNALANAISRHLWHIEESEARSLYSIAILYLEGKYQQQDEIPPIQPFAISAIHGIQQSITDTNEEGLIAIFPIQGPMMKEDTMSGNPGTATMCKWLREAKANPSVIAGILYVDSPGGAVDGSETFHNEIKSFDAAKPLVTYADGKMCSAAYQVGCAPSEIIASERTTLIGSIGTMFRTWDDTGRMEQMGYKKLEAYADDSSDKNKTYNELLAGNDKPIKNEILNPMNDLFLETVKTNRGSKLNSKAPGVLSGAVFTAELAIANGLIDSIGSFDYAVQRAHELANERKLSSQQNSTSMKLKDAWSNIKSFLGIKTGEEITETQMEQLNSELATHETVRSERDSAQASLAAANSELELLRTDKKTLGDANASLTAERDNWKQKAEKFGAKDASDVKETAGTEDKFDSKEKQELPSMKVMKEHFPD